MLLRGVLFEEVVLATLSTPKRSRMLYNMFMLELNMKLQGAIPVLASSGEAGYVVLRGREKSSIWPF